MQKPNRMEILHNSNQRDIHVVLITFSPILVVGQEAAQCLLFLLFGKKQLNAYSTPYMPKANQMEFFYNSNQRDIHIVYLAF